MCACVFVMACAVERRSQKSIRIDRWEKCWHSTMPQRNSGAVISNKGAERLASLAVFFFSVSNWCFVLFCFNNSTNLLTSVSIHRAIIAFSSSIQNLPAHNNERKCPRSENTKIIGFTLSLLLVVLSLICSSACVRQAMWAFNNSAHCMWAHTQRSHGQTHCSWFFLFLFVFHMLNETVRRRVNEMQNQVNAWIIELSVLNRLNVHCPMATGNSRQQNIVSIKC